MRSFTRLAVMVLLVAIFVGSSGALALEPFVEVQKLTIPELGASSNFSSVVSMNGVSMVVGSPNSDCDLGQSCGAVHAYRFDGTTWVEEQILTPSDVKPTDKVGRAVSVSGDTVIVGRSRADCATGTQCGSSYVFRYNGTSWYEAQKLTASDVSANDHFGNSVSVNGDTAVVGAFQADCDAGVRCGAAYVFRFDGTNWVEEQKLVASDAAQEDNFGSSVVVSVDTVVVGAPDDNCAAGALCGSAYVFHYNGTSWVEQQKLTASDAGFFDSFGWSVSKSGDTIVVSAHLAACVAGDYCGSAYVFRFDGTNWIEQQKLTASDAGAEDNFGVPVSVSGNTAIVGAHESDCASDDDCGSVYVFYYDGTSWVEQQKLSASDTSQVDFFGFSASLSGDVVAIGATTSAACGSGSPCGGAYVFNGLGSTFVVSSPKIAAAPHDKTRDRYLSFNPSSNPDKMTALRVTRVGSTASSYVSCALDYAGADGRVGQLVQSPEFCEWTNAVIHIRGCDVVPGNEYMIEATADGVAYSAPVSIFTTAPQIDASRSYGDLVGAFENGEWKAAEGIVTANDIVAVVQKFQLLDSAPHISRVDTDGQTPNGILAGNDILREVLAFAGSEFGFGVTGCLSGTCVPNCP